VPEGDYLLRVSSAGDTVVEHGAIQGDPTGTFTRNKVLQSYLDTEQPLNVTGDLSGIMINMVVKVDSGNTKSEDF
jgi:hypothetical protein